MPSATYRALILERIIRSSAETPAPFSPVVFGATVILLMTRVTPSVFLAIWSACAFSIGLETTPDRVTTPPSVSTLILSGPVSGSNASLLFTLAVMAESVTFRPSQLRLANSTNAGSAINKLLISLFPVRKFTNFLTRRTTCAPSAPFDRYSRNHAQSQSSKRYASANHWTIFHGAWTIIGYANETC